MAGPKLTKEKRSELRKEIGEQVAAKGDLAGIVKSLSEKYGIGTNAVRWHHKKVVGGEAATKPQGVRRGRPKSPPRMKQVLKAERSGRRGRPSSFRALAAELGKFSPADLRRAIKASKIQVMHDKLVAQATQMRRQLKATERRTRDLERRLAGIIGE